MDTSSHDRELSALTGHIALVTGGRRGIGRAIMCRLAAHGAAVVFTCVDTSEDFVSETLEILRKAGAAHGLIEADLADGASRSDLVDRASSLFGPPDIIVNNAALGDVHQAPPSGVTLGQRRTMFEVNLHAPVDLIQQALPMMKDKGWGRIVNLLSDSIHQQPVPYLAPAGTVHGLTAYGASKAALERFTLGLAAELHGTGVHINGLYPHKVAVTESQSARAVAGMRAQPQAAESLETMAEAAYQLVTGSFTGLSTNSRAFLHSLQQSVRSLDGRTVVGDATTVPDL
ncbi:SDR family oxidoreductase [Pseudofrankia sp. BMG5.37]|uniref:SDR family NAD(P)-dependent oxidoreductase n=1 Tax=Pseudofrankia sp. BMG5.37 TaxID=3050035 RepID=UPI002895F04D|nr:SDR family oxidoreductase [Pseudofrankia sp. BMG5.37]MDT3440210.1 SDR family oxidoreductase [Pseudofrankia sp. BMG5.37]